MAVRSLLHRLGYRFRLHRKDLPGQPDIVLPRYRAAIFVHGCYWHRHKGCKFAYTPKTRTDFWRRKFSDNVLRDKRTRDQLEQAGWQVIIVWECEIRNLNVLTQHLICLLKKEEDSAREIAHSNTP